MVEAAVKNGTDEIRKEMVSLKGEIVQGKGLCRSCTSGIKQEFQVPNATPSRANEDNFGCYRSGSPGHIGT
jgi:hypothetical protein